MRAKDKVRRELPSRSGSPRGVTVVEVVIAFAILVVVMASLWGFFSQSRRSQKDLTGGFAAQQDLMLAMQTITREVQEGVRIFYPSPGKPAQSGLGFISHKGRAIMFFLDTSSAPTGPNTTAGTAIVRLDLVANTRKEIARNVNYFKVKVEPHEEGKKACLATINLSILRGRQDVAGKADDYNLITKVFLRNVNQDLPQPE